MSNKTNLSFFNAYIELDKTCAGQAFEGYDILLIKTRNINGFCDFYTKKIIG